MLKNPTLGRVTKSLVFCLGVVALLSALSFVMMPAGVITDPWGAVEKTRGEADVLVMGSSRAYCTVLPMEMWRKNGTTALDITGGVQPMAVTAEYLRQSLALQHPKVVLLELYMVGKMVPFDATRAHPNLDRMPMGLPRTAAIWRSVEATGVFETLFPLYLYHSRWNELTATDFALDKSSRNAYARGATYMPKASQVPTDVAYDEVGEAGYARDLQYVREMARLCQSNGINLVLFTSPSRWRLRIGDQLLLSRLQADLTPDFPAVVYLDMNAVADDIGIDPAKDYLDELHLNSRGAVKVSQWLAVQLAAGFALPDHRRDALAVRWNADLRKYDAVFKPW